MTYKPTILIGCLIMGASLFQYCTKSGVDADVSAVSVSTAAIDGGPVLPVVNFDYANFPLPAHIAACLATDDNTPAANAITNNGAALGRVLFYDKHLSKNTTISCASCHNPAFSFSDTAIKSKGFLGGNTTRHSMRLVNTRFYRSGKMFWDERANTLEEQVLMPVQNTVEMGLTLAELESNVASLSYYPALFQKAFGTPQINSDRIAKALAQFIRSIVTYQSKYDQVKQGLATFTADELDGETIFTTTGNITCAGCHAPPMFLTSSPERPFALADPNDAGINGQPRFKSGSLRNIAISGALFHNGSIPTLETMLGIGGAAVIPLHSVGPQDRRKLLAFLKTLTDTTTISAAKYSDPFPN